MSSDAPTVRRFPRKRSSQELVPFGETRTCDEMPANFNPDDPLELPANFRAIVRRSKGAIAQGWRWYTNMGERVDPNVMEVDHMHYVVRMIWNHTMPVKVSASGEYTWYEFDREGVHTYGYHVQAVKILLPLLLARWHELVSKTARWELLMMYRIAMDIRVKDAYGNEKERLFDDTPIKVENWYVDLR